MPLIIRSVFINVVNSDDGVSSDVIEVWDIMVPGKPTELCYISEQGDLHFI